MSLRLLQTKGTIDLERFRIPFRVYGEGEDIVCINGAQQSMAMWFSFIKNFSGRYRITLFDFPYQGKAKIKNNSEPVSIEEEVYVLHSVIKRLNIKNATITSASWGGVCALLFAIRHPGFARLLVLASIGIRPNKLMRDIILKGINMNNRDRKEIANVLIQSFGHKLPDNVKAQVVNQFNSMSCERLKAFCDHGMRVLSHDSLDKVVPLSEVKVNTVILYGEKDTILDYQDVAELTERIPCCRIEAVPGVGHFLHLEDEYVFKVYEAILLEK